MSDLFELEDSATVSREEAARRLHALADALARHNEVEFVRGGKRITVDVPDQVTLAVEIEVGDGDGELEIELSW